MSVLSGTILPGGEAAAWALLLALEGPMATADVSRCVVGRPEVKSTITGATTLTVDLDDATRKLTRSGVLNTRSFAVLDGLHLETAAVTKAGDLLTVTFEDAVVAALRRRTSPRTFAAGSATLDQVVRELAAEAGVRIDVDPDARNRRVADAVERSADGQPSSSWDVLGRLGDDRAWRCYSDARGLVFGSDAWLRTRVPATAMREHTGGVQDVDYTIDTGQAASTATATVHTDAWSVAAGLPVDVTDLGPADGRWLVETFRRPVSSVEAEVKLTRERPSLLEPPPSRTEDRESGEQGETDFLPDPTTGAPARAAATPAPRSARAAEASAASAGRERMLAWARDHAGTRYRWGGSGPREFDCSGWVQEATRAGGKALPKPAHTQLIYGRRHGGREISVEQALKTPGALLFRIGVGNLTNHVAISTGDGYTLEARGSAYPNGRHLAYYGRRWTHALVWFT